jgi:HTH-type transcriptional regulator, pleiotropic regulator of extracellular virulence genes
MFELNKVELGKEIKFLRKLNKLSQNEMAEGICTQPTISGIEAGKVYPSVDILYLLSIRLKVNFEHFVKILLNDTKSYIEETKGQIEILLKNKNYHEIYEICTFELSQRKSREIGFAFEQYINWTYIISKYYLKLISTQECIEHLNKMLEQQHLLSSYEFQDLKISNSLAIIYAENKLYEESLEQYKKILILKESLIQKPKFYLKIHYNLSKLHYLLEEYENSLSHVQQGIYLSKKIEDISVLGQLFFQQGECFERLSRPLEDISECYKRSMQIFEVLNRNTYIQMLKEQKGKFILE